MLLVVDVGNTQTHFGVVDGDELAQHWRFATVRTMTADELGAQLLSLLELRGFSFADLDDGDVGRELYGWLAEAFEAPADLKVLVMHHHLVAIPGTGRDRNQVWDAGDVLALLARCGVDLMLGGHRHVPHVWPVAGLHLVHSGTVSTGRVRGYARPSYNLVEVEPHELRVEARHPGGPRELLARFPRPAMTGGEHRAVEAVRPVRGLRIG